MNTPTNPSSDPVEEILMLAAGAGGGAVLAGVTDANKIKEAPVYKEALAKINRLLVEVYSLNVTHE